MEKANKEFRGVSLFNDIEDRDLRIRNRAVILTNALEDGFENGRVSGRSSLFIIGYFNEIPKEEKQETSDLFVKFAAERGFVLQ